ncbi:MAG: pantoate--beta-alanine ligase [Terriglobales bacterium]
MRLLTDPAAFQALCRQRAPGLSLGLVPTMGALHAGHLSLVAASRRQDDLTAVSIFVNPAQFGPHEDFDRYPRQLEADCALLEAAGVQLVFAPPVAAMYPPGDATRIETGGLSERLDGASRPGHFRGVATVVSKLFHLALPTRAYFGQKDAAQLAVIRCLARDLFFPIDIVACPIIREPDAVAMSSRNALLSPAERRAATALSQALRRIGELYAVGERATVPLVAAGRAVIAAEPGLRLDFLEAADGATLLPTPVAAPGTLFAAAAFAGATRLIDNAHIAADESFVL